MVRKTPQELLQAKKALEAERRAAERAEQERLDWLLHARERHAQLESVVGGLYDELDKIARKWPTMPVTERQVTRTNKFLGAVRELLVDEEDEFGGDLADLVPAGDMPETRDVVFILREATDALRRFEREHEPEWRRVQRAV
jgi:hypothetical protein